MNRILLTFTLGLISACGAWAEDADKDAKPAPPQITQDEILQALGLEISKIRIVGIPSRKEIVMALEERTAKPQKWRTIGRFSVTPETDWIEVLVSARKEPNSSCRRFDITVHHESPIHWEWPIDIEKLFGAGSRAVFPEHTLDFLRTPSTVIRYNGGCISLAGFRIAGDRTRKTYEIRLNKTQDPNPELSRVRR